MTDDLTSSISILFASDQVIEIRAITDDGVASGYFDSQKILAEKVSVLDGMQNVQGIYGTLNEVNPSLLSRRANRIKMRLGKKDATTADADIIRRRWLPIDIDPIRPSGVSSTDEEHQAALDRAGIIGCYLTEWGFPEPLIADSGNGAHLLYRIDLPNDSASLDLVKQCLETLSVLFSDDVANVDTANHNAARIWKLYGTVSRKGDNTKTRPHRRARIINIPECIGIVNNAQLERLSGALPSAPAAPAAARSKARGKTDIRLDLPTWLGQQGIGITSQKEFKDGILYNLDECPFSSAHKDGAYAIQFLSGGLFAGCKHASCGGGKPRWEELREMYEPEEGRKPSSKPRSPGGPPPAPKTAVTLAEIPNYNEAMDVLKYGDPPKAMLATFALDHIGDEVPAECLIASLASRYVDNNNGLHVSVSGESGKGKSDTFNKILLQVPERFRLEGAMSNKALFFMDDLKPGTVIVFDDKLLSEDMQEILKGATSSFKNPINYRTVSQERKAMICSIPERCIWWVAKVEGSGDDQVFNRMLTCWIDDSPEQDAAVLVEMAKNEGKIPDTLNAIRPEVLTCRAIWEIIGRERLHVVIPYSTRVEFQSKANRRNPEMFYSLIKAHAMLFFMQRERLTLDTGGSYIVATLDDFYAAGRLFKELNGVCGGQESKLIRREAEILDAVSKFRYNEFTVQQVQQATGLSNQAVHRTLHGYQSRGATYSGLLDKCPAISFVDRTIVNDDDDVGSCVRRRCHAYQFNRAIFDLWSGGGGVWLRAEEIGDEENFPTPAVRVSTPAAVAEDVGNECNAGESVNDGCKSPPPISEKKCTAATAEGVANADRDSESANEPRITNTLLSNSDTFSKSQISRHPVRGGDTPCTCARDSGFAEGVGAISLSSTPIENSVPLNEIVTFSSAEGVVFADNEYGSRNGCHVLSPSDLGGNSTDVPAAGVGKFAAGGISATIVSQDFKLLDYHDNRSTCTACGRKGTDYIEKVTLARKSRKDRLAVRICKKCFGVATRKEQTKAPPLPGMIVLGRMVRISKDIGRCSVCNIGKAVFTDREAGTRVCQQCYDREARAHGSMNGGAGR